MIIPEIFLSLQKGVFMYRTSVLHASEVHMETGPIGRTLLAYTVPILLSQLLQQLYSIADSAVIGHCGGEQGLAAVGEASLVLSVIVNFFIGFSTGVSALTAQEFGGRKYPTLRRTIWVSTVCSLLFGILLTVCGIILAPQILHGLNCPKETYAPALTYLCICFFGLPAQLIYNTSNAILRSLGNTKTPLYYLSGASVLNLFLDLLFVIVFDLSLPGAAWATVLSQWVLAVLMLWKLCCLDEAYHLCVRCELRTLNEVKDIVRQGFPCGMQAIFMSLSSIILQTYINSFGSAAAAGMVVYARIEGFIYYPAFSFGLALTGFVGQNLGANRPDRLRESLKTSLWIAAVFTLPASLVLSVFAPQLLLLFTTDSAIIACGTAAIRTILPWYILYSLDQVFLGTLKGLGDTAWPMICSLICYCIFRVVWCHFLLPIWPSMQVVYNSYNVSLALMMVLLIPRCMRCLNKMSFFATKKLK